MSDIVNGLFDRKELRAEIKRLRAEVKQARDTSEFWKANHLAGNAEIDRLRAALKPFTEAAGGFTISQLHAAREALEAKDE